MQKITENVYVESELSACNTGVVVTGEGVVVVDTPMAPAAAQQVAAEIAKLGTVRYVINGEPHTDHISGNGYFGGKVVAHEGTRRIILEADAEAFKEQLRRMAPGSPVPDDFRYRAPEITLTDSLTLFLGKHTFHLMHLPGHTPYNLAVHVPEERLVFTSDNINLGMPIFISALPDKWLESLEWLEKLDVDIVVPGHGEVCGREAFSQMKAKVNDWTDAVGAAVKRGLNPADTVNAIMGDKRFRDIPREGPMVDFIRANIESLYLILQKQD